MGYVRGDVDLGRDAELVHRFQAGDGSAFDELYGEYYDRLRRYCRRRLHDDALAEDVAQEAFTRAYRALPRLRGERRFYPWLTVIASRLCIDTIRKDGRSIPVADPPVPMVHSMVGPEDAALAAEDRVQLATALAGLRPRYREVLRLREDEGLSAREIAAQQGTSVGSVEVALHRARHALRQRFEAVAGALAGLPLLPGLLRRARLAAWRLNIQPETPTGALAGALAATAIVLGAAAGPSAGPASADAGRVTGPVHAAPAAADYAPAPLPAPEPPAPDLPPAGDSGDDTAGRAGPAEGADPPVVITSADEARSRGDDSDIKGDTGDAFVGLDADEVVAEVTDRTIDYLDQLGGQQ